MSRNIIYILAVIFSLLTFANIFSAEIISPELQRAEILSALSSVILFLIAILWQDINPRMPPKSKLKGKEGFYINEIISNDLRDELAWGSQMILTATAAATILIYWNDTTVLKRGIISNSEFTPGKICLRAKQKQSIISLVNTKYYPGKLEFDNLLEGLPSIIIYPLKDSGFIIIGGWSERCFTMSDEKWIIGWGNKLSTMFKI